VFLGALSAGLNPGELLRGSRPIIIMLILTGAPRCLAYPPLAFNRAGFGEALLFSGGILVSFAAGALLFSVTTMGELRDSLAAAGDFLRDRFAPYSRKKGPRLSLAISLMLGFLPRFFEIWETAGDAYRARGGKRGPAGIFVIVSRVIEGVLVKAGDTAQALEARTPRW
jgi:biotin transport system permease protein